MDHETLRLEAMKLAAAEGLHGEDLDVRADYLFTALRYGKAEADRIRTEAIFAKRRAVDRPFDDYLKRDDPE